MNKFAKGGIAAAAAIALLMGGAGSLAYWSTSQSYNPGSISTGHLTLTSAGAGSWVDPEITHWVPGDSNTYNASYTLSVVGDNIGVDFTVGSPSGGSLPAGLSATPTITVKDSGGLTVADTSDLSEGTYTVTASTVVTFDSAATGSMDASGAIGSVALTATQVAP